MRQFIVFVCLMLVLVCAACSGTGAGAPSDGSLPAGDASRGATLFTQMVNGAPSCNTCHTLDGSTLVGPSLKGFGVVAATRVEGVSAQDYAHDSIVKPASYIVPGFPNVMYGQFGKQLTAQQTADLIAYILTL
jgi:mono/diheme cytochrome c family protein